MLLLLPLLSLVVGSIPSHRVVDLPGASGDSKLYSGYLNVSSALGDLRVFYFFASNANPALPLTVWMNGGPGASSLMGMFTELGPLLMNSRSRPSENGGKWKLFENRYSWSSVGSLLAWEQPAGVGFSRCVRGCPAQWNDTSAAVANYEVLRAFFAAFPEEKQRDLYITGESYAGIYVPTLAEQVARKSSGDIKLKGVAIGNGCIGFGVEGACGTDTLDNFVSVMESVSPDPRRTLIDAVRTSCEGQLDKGFGPGDLSASCKGDMRALFENVGNYNVYHWGSACGPTSQGNWGDGSAFSCGSSEALQEYLSTAEAQRSLHVIPESSTTPIKWQAWDGDWTGYNITMADALPVYRSLLHDNIPMLIYNGLRDTAVPFVGAKKWVPRVAPKITSPWRLWASPSSNDIAGHVQTYENGVTFVTVEGAGHLVPGDRPQQALAMISSFLTGNPLPTYDGPPCEPMFTGRGYADFCDDTDSHLN